MKELKNIIEAINNSENWADCLEECEKLCELAGLSEEWNKASGENFEKVLKKASCILNCDIGL
jgi:hypothetical protein